MAFSLRISGPKACFPRIDFERDLISYDTIPAVAARGIFEAVYWTPAIRWRIDEIRVLNAIRDMWLTLPNREHGEVPARVLTDVDYVVTARFDLTKKASPYDNGGQHAAMFRRRLRQGRFFRTPYLGLKAYHANVEGIESELELPPIESTLRGEIDLGWILHDILWAGPRATPSFVRPMMRDGVINLREDADLIVSR